MPGRDGVSSERLEIIDYLKSQLIGPAGGAVERLPSKDPATLRYLMGTLYPADTSTQTVLDQEEEDGAPDPEAEAGGDSPISLAFQTLPASVGISFYIEGHGKLKCSVHAACYELSKEESGNRKFWVRKPIAEKESPESRELTPPSGEGGESPKLDVLDGRGKLHAVWRPMGNGYLVTLTLMNSRQGTEGRPHDPADCLHQVGITATPLEGRIRHYPRGGKNSWDVEEEELILLYRKKSTYAIGHGCAAGWGLEPGGKVSWVGTEHLPTVEVPRTTTDLPAGASGGESGSPGIDPLQIQYLADDLIPDKELRLSLGKFVDGYRVWIESLKDQHPDIPRAQYSVRDRILGRLREAESRMRKGIVCITSDRKVRRAFNLANTAMLMQMAHSTPEYGGSPKDRNAIPFREPDYRSASYRDLRWRPFQLAFLLLAVESTVNELSAQRDIVDLIWFPTGGGKTEAYLALAALEMFHRRIVYGPAGGGTSVIKRYTLRLLTSQQFQRAATLVCACESIRRGRPEEFGDEPFTLGLWVGGEVCPNNYTGENGAVELLRRLREEDKPENPFQLQRCPWCGTRIVPLKKEESPDNYGIKADVRSFLVYCPSDDCPFHSRIPVSVIDEDLYDRPPSFLIGTIDKFARMAWDFRSRSFFGKGNGEGKRPPSLIIQDELHLISGPLGTIAGVYEAAIDTLICDGGTGIRPKIIAATATIRRASDQARKLYGRDVAVFPPPGLLEDNSYFYRVDTSQPGRIYAGVMGQGHTPVTSLVQTAAALSQAPVELALINDARDGYWTQVIFHNSRRELGKTRTLARDDIPARIKVIARDQSRMRRIEPYRVVELSANTPARQIPEVLDRLQSRMDSRDVIDMLPCTNMLSVGVDVSRLGLILVNGQPKTTAEYIQVSSRVGRAAVPGLVVTLYSGTKPRDRSHYEGFRPYHEALYRAVEPTSVTPYALPARERALHASIVILARHAGGLPENADPARLDVADPVIQRLLIFFKERIRRADPSEAASSVNHINAILDQWVSRIREAAATGRPLRYDPQAGNQFLSLLCTFENKTGGSWPTLNSMRNVDAECRIRVSGENR